MATTAPTRSKTAASTQKPVLEGGNAPQATQVATVAANASGALALPAELQAELAAAAKDVAAKERPTVSKISLKSGVLHYMDEPMEGSAMDVVVISSVYRNVFYAGRYDPNNIVNPNCFSLSDDDEDTMVPHPNVAEPVSATCVGCPNAEWGSDPNSPSGRGKWCKQSRRLVVLPADALASPKAVKESELALLDVPVTSVGNWANFVNTLSTGSKLPFWAAVANLASRPHPKKQVELIFTPLRAITDVEVLRAVMVRREDAQKIALTPWDETMTAEAQAAAEAAAAAARKTPQRKKF